MSRNEEADSASQDPGRGGSFGLKDKVLELDRRFGIFRAIKFGGATAAGFLVTEAILTLGVYILYGSPLVPSSDFTSLQLIILNVVAFAVGVTVAFFVNEHVTVSDSGYRRQQSGAMKTLVRLAKYQLVYVLGNAITIGVQLALLGTLSVAPSIGNIIGAIVAFPVSYLISMRYVWKIANLGSQVSTSGPSPTVRGMDI